MRVITRQAKAVEAGGQILAAAKMKGIGTQATSSAAEWALVVTNDKGKRIAFQYWWQMADPAINGNRIEWSSGAQRVAVVAPMTPEVADTIAARVADPNRRAHYDAALAAAVDADRQETDDLHAAKAAKAAQRKGDGSVVLTTAQAAALRRDSQRNWTIAAAALLAVAVACGLIALLSLEGDNANTPSRSEPSGCTWDWVPGKAPVDVGWKDAVQYCYPD